MDRDKWFLLWYCVSHDRHACLHACINRNSKYLYIDFDSELPWRHFVGQQFFPVSFKQLWSRQIPRIAKKKHMKPRDCVFFQQWLIRVRNWEAQLILRNLNSGLVRNRAMKPEWPLRKNYLGAWMRASITNRRSSSAFDAFARKYPS